LFLGILGMSNVIPFQQLLYSHIISQPYVLGFLNPGGFFDAPWILALGRARHMQTGFRWGSLPHILQNEGSQGIERWRSGDQKKEVHD